MLFCSRVKFWIELVCCQDPDNITLRKSLYGLSIAGVCYSGVSAISFPDYVQKVRRASALAMPGMRAKRFKSP